MSDEPLFVGGGAAGVVRAAPVGGGQRARRARGAHAAGCGGRDPTEDETAPERERKWKKIYKLK